MSTTLVHFFTPFPLCVDVIYGSPLPRPTCGGTSEGHTNCGGGKRRRRQARQCHLLQGRFLYPQGNSTISPNHHLNDGWNRLHSAPHHHTHNSKFKTENATCRNIRKSHPRNHFHNIVALQVWVKFCRGGFSNAAKEAFPGGAYLKDLINSIPDKDNSPAAAAAAPLLNQAGGVHLRKGKDGVGHINCLMLSIH